jgi:hypothetical protein
MPLRFASCSLFVLAGVLLCPAGAGAEAPDEQLRQFDQAVRKTPDDLAAREAIIQYLLIVRGEPHRARRYLHPAMNEAWRSYVPLAARPIHTLPAEVALEMADWYATLAQAAPTDRRGTILRQVRAYLNQGLSRLDDSDPRTETTLSRLRTIDQTLAELNTQTDKLPWSLDAPTLGLVADQLIRNSITQAQRYLFRSQHEQGYWDPGSENPHRYSRQATTALVCYALRETDTRVWNPNLRKAIAWLTEQPQPRDTLGLAWRVMLWQSLLGERAYRNQAENHLRKDAALLLAGTVDGTYTRTIDPAQPTRNGMAFYTAVATLALARASDAGVDISKDQWNRFAARWKTRQTTSGGWGELPGNLPSINATAAGLTSVLLALDRAGRPRENALRYSAVRTATAWFDYRFDGKSIDDPMHYYLLLGRQAVARGENQINNIEWFPWLCKELLFTQLRSGAWQPKGHSPQVSTAAGLLALRLATIGR